MAACALESSPRCRLEKARRVVPCTASMERLIFVSSHGTEGHRAHVGEWARRSAALIKRKRWHSSSRGRTPWCPYRQDLAAVVLPPCLDLDRGVVQRRGERDACSTACGHHSPCFRSMRQRRRPAVARPASLPRGSDDKLDENGANIVGYE
jgi:hypothetical protein